LALTKPRITGVSLICTVYNEREKVADFLTSICEMTHLPDEIVIVDGGSQDGTPDTFRTLADQKGIGYLLKLIVRPDCNIKFTPGPVGKGRNIAVSEASHEIIVSTDCGCRVDKTWLKNVTAPFFSGNSPDVVGGWYLSDGVTYFERALGLSFFIPPTGVTSSSIVPSSRSIAFLKSVWTKVGGYPENSLTAEDTLFALRLRGAGARFVYQPDAIVYWKGRHDLVSFATLVYRYGYGDGFNRIFLQNVTKCLAKLVINTLICLLAIVDFRILILLPIFWWILIFGKRLRQPFRWYSLALFPMAIFLKIFFDIVYPLGYFIGLVSKKPTAFAKAD